MQSGTYAVDLQCGGSSSAAPPQSWGIGCVASYSQVSRSPWRCLWGTAEQRQAGQASPEESCRVGTKQICKSLSSGKQAYRYSWPIKHISRCSAHVGHFKNSKWHHYFLSYKAVFIFQKWAVAGLPKAAATDNRTALAFFLLPVCPCVSIADSQEILVLALRCFPSRSFHV